MKTEEFWRKMCDEVGPAEAIEIAGREQGNVSSVAEVAINKWLTNEEFTRPIRREKREIESQKIAENTLGAVREGNTTQFWVLVVLALTMLTTIATCRVS